MHCFIEARYLAYKNHNIKSLFVSLGDLLEETNVLEWLKTEAKDIEQEVVAKKPQADSTIKSKQVKTKTTDGANKKEKLKTANKESPSTVKAKTTSPPEAKKPKKEVPSAEVPSKKKPIKVTKPANIVISKVPAVKNETGKFIRID